MKRRIANCLVLLSLLLAVTVAGLWVRSVWWQADKPPFCSGLSCNGHLWALFNYWIDNDLSHEKWMALGASVRNQMLPAVTIRFLDQGVIVGIADWVLLIVLSVPPTLWLAFNLHRHLRSCLCVKCGHGFQASRDTCPECGAPVPAPKPRG